MKYEELTGTIIEAAYKVHNSLGFGFLENVYQNALSVELKKRQIDHETEKHLKVYYEKELVGDYKADIVVDDKVILELKAIKDLNSAHESQLVNYLKATGIEVGLLINFGNSVEIRRKVLDRS